MTKPRTPPVWLVLLPALALAAVGVRAVTAEMRASEDAARERARSVASRLARSVDALVNEYEAALPRAAESITRREALVATVPLRPRRAVTPDGASLLISHPPDIGRLPVFEPDQPLVAEARERARRLADGPSGRVAAAALLAGTASALTDPRLSAELKCEAFELDPAAVTQDRAAELAREAIGALVWDRDSRGRPIPVAALAALAANAGVAEETKMSLAALVAEDPWGLQDAARDRVLDDLSRSLTPSTRAHLDELRATWNDARTQGRRNGGGGPGPAPTFRVGASDPVLTVWNPTRIDGREVLLGGDIPAEVVRSRIEPEVQSLSHERSVYLVRLVGPDGRHAFVAGNASVWGLPDLIVEAQPVRSIPGWHAEAVCYPGATDPTTAWLLAAALGVTTAALVAGTLALRRAAERSARLAEDRQTFLDHVAHELRTPAAAVQALTEELASGHVTKEREPQYREHLLRESRRLSALVEDTLDLTRLDAGRLAFKMEPADLRDVVRRAIEESSVAGRVVATLPDAAVVRAVDEGTLRRAVKNLVENAVRHGGGDAPVTVALEASDGHASIVVADKGRGIAAEHLPRLFERFYRVPSATHEVKGVGLGLALCREVARAHGGDVSVESRVGTGSTFTLSIPLV